jgi:triphosphoribosyl-dephospho-CoA synthase
VTELSDKCSPKRGTCIFTPKQIALAAQAACLLEVSAPKPGNVNRQHDFPDACFEDFLLSAAAIDPAMARAGRVGVGQTILRAVRDTRRVVRTNTNLGMVLLLAPLAKAAWGAGERGSESAICNLQSAISGFRGSVAQVLADLTVEDARHAYAAIRLARPGGLGRAAQADVAEEPAITLRQAMALAQERDAIAREYVTDFAITFEIGYPALRQAWRELQRSGCSPGYGLVEGVGLPMQPGGQGGLLAAAIVQTYLTVLARVPDTLVGRKRGPETAAQVSRWAADALAVGGVFTPQGRQAVADLDRALRDEHHTLNPGTTADLAAATLFVWLLLDSPFGA